MSNWAGDGCGTHDRTCPVDLKEAISSLIYASPRCADLPELIQIRTLFTAKYGKEFVASATELRPDCGVNRRVSSPNSSLLPSWNVPTIAAIYSWLPTSVTRGADIAL